MTAAHCVQNSINTLIIAGAHDRRVIEPTQQRRTIAPANYRIHGIFNPVNRQNDIAILQLPAIQPFTLNLQVNVVRLPTAFPNDQFVGEIGMTLGWGRTAENGQTSGVLRSGMNPVIANAVCETGFPNRIIPGIVCVATVGATQGACTADEGGVLTVTRPGDLRRVQIGIMSFTHANGCVMGQPIAYTRVTSFLSFIAENTNPPN
jgi:secreted trypsin-like serine protease